MYSNDIIQALEKRIGFGSDNGISISIDNDLKEGTSGRTFPYFHQLATIPNLYFTTREIDMSKADFEAFLNQLLKDSVLSSLTAVLNQSVDYIDAYDYDNIIDDKISIFDDVIGYTLAITAIEKMISSPRKNDDERNISLSYSQLKMELEGVRSDAGHIVSQGLNRKLQDAIRKARLIIFPNPVIVTSREIW